MSENNGRKGYYVPTILLGLIVAGIFIASIFLFQVSATEKALVLTMGKITDDSVRGPGLHFRYPLPFQEVIKYDVRKRCFDGNIGKLEETTTRDQKQVVIGINVFYNIEDVVKFKTAASLAAAEDYLGSRMRTVKAAVVGRYDYDQLINVDPAKMKLGEMRQEMLAAIAPDVLDKYGLKVCSVQFTSIGVPEKTADAIAARMKQERETMATEYRDQGRTQANAIRTAADLEKRKTVADAESKAKELMAQGDAEAAKRYAVFAQEPELALFLRKLDSMKKILSSKTTLIIGTDSAPFDVFNSKFGTPSTAAQPSAAENAR